MMPRIQYPVRIKAPRTLSFSPLFKPSILTFYSTLLYEGGRLCFDPDGVGLVATERGLQAVEAGVQTRVDVFAGSGNLIPAAV